MLGSEKFMQYFEETAEKINEHYTNSIDRAISNTANVLGIP